MKSRTEILVPLAAIQAVPIAVIAWYRLHRYAWYRYSAIVKKLFCAGNKCGEKAEAGKYAKSADSGAKSCFFRHFWHHYRYFLQMKLTIKCYPDSDTRRHRNSAKKTDCHQFYMILNELIIHLGHYRLSPYLVRLNIFISTKVPFA